MKIKVEKCGESEKVGDEDHWEVGALYQFTSSFLGKRGSYYYCFKREGHTYIVGLNGINSVHDVECVNVKDNRKLTKGECTTLTVE